MEWAELPFGRQTLHHDWLLPYRGLQASLFVLSLGIELTHFLHPKLPTVIRIGEQDSGRAVPSPPDGWVRWQTMVLGHSREPPSGERSTVTVPSGASPCRWPNGQLEQSGAGVMYENLRIHGATFRSKPVGFSSAVFFCGGVGDNHYCHTIDGWRHCRNDCRRLVSTGLTYGQRENPQLQSG